MQLQAVNSDTFMHFVLMDGMDKLGMFTFTRSTTILKSLVLMLRQSENCSVHLDRWHELLPCGVQLERCRPISQTEYEFDGLHDLLSPCATHSFMLSGSDSQIMTIAYWKCFEIMKPYCCLP